MARRNTLRSKHSRKNQTPRRSLRTKRMKRSNKRSNTKKRTKRMKRMKRMKRTKRMKRKRSQNKIGGADAARAEAARLVAVASLGRIYENDNGDTLLDGDILTKEIEAQLRRDAAEPSADQKSRFQVLVDTGLNLTTELRQLGDNNLAFDWLVAEAGDDPEVLLDAHDLSIAFVMNGGPVNEETSGALWELAGSVGMDGNQNVDSREFVQLVEMLDGMRRRSPRRLDLAATDQEREDKDRWNERKARRAAKHKERLGKQDPKAVAVEAKRQASAARGL